MKIIKFRRPLKKRIKQPGIGQKPTKTKGECCCQTLTGFPPSAFWGLAATLLTLLDGIDAGRWDSQPKGDPKQKITLKPNLRIEWIDLYPCCIHKYDILRCVEVYMLKYVEVIYAQNAHYYILHILHEHHFSYAAWRQTI